MTTVTLKYKIGDKGQSGETIEYIYGHSEQVIVYRDSNGKLQWESGLDQLTPAQTAVHTLHDRLSARARACLSESKIGLLRDDLAQALFLGLSDTDEAKALSRFDALAATVAQEARTQAQFEYAIAASCLGLLTIAASAVIAWAAGDVNVELIVLSASTGAVGAWASVLQRASRLVTSQSRVARRH